MHGMAVGNAALQTAHMSHLQTEAKGQQEVKASSTAGLSQNHDYKNKNGQEGSDKLESKFKTKTQQVNKQQGDSKISPSRLVELLKKGEVGKRFNKYKYGLNIADGQSVNLSESLA